MAWWEPVPVADPAEGFSPIFVIEIDASAGENIVNVIEPTTASSFISVVPTTGAARDEGHIMIQSITQDYFQTNIKNFLPYEFWRMDAKLLNEGGGEGNLENFVQVFAITLDEIKQAIDEFVLLFDIDHCPPKYLRTIAELLNYPLEDTDSTAEKREQLKQAIEWYKSKGARRAFVAILYAFGYHAEVIPLWTQYTEDNYYEVFTETIPGVAAGNDPPNDYPLLVENGGTWFRSPHFGIRLRAIVEDNHLDIEWGTLTENEIPVTDELVATTPDGVMTEFTGTLEWSPILAGTVTGKYFVGSVWLEDIVDDGLGVLSGTDVTGTIDYDTGEWSLEFVNPPSNGGDIIFDYTYDFSELIDEIGYHRAFYRVVDILTKAGATLRYHFDNDEFWYMWRRIEFLRPVFTVLDWIEHGLEMYEYFNTPEGEDPVITVNPTRSEKGWYLGYCDLDDIQYTRLDSRLLGSDLTITSPLGGGAPAVSTINLPPGAPQEVAASVSGVITSINGTLANQWLYSGVEFLLTIGGNPYAVLDNGEGVLIGEDDTVYGLIDYTYGTWELIFEGVTPDNPSDIYVAYSYTTEVPPCDRSGAFPRGSTALPFPHLRDPQEGYCHPPEELFVDWFWTLDEEYQLALTRDGMNLYPPAGPVLYIDHADFPSRGFENSLGAAGHANTFTREYGYSTRPLSLLRVRALAAAAPDPDVENWENQDTAWEAWTGPWENIGD